MSALRAVSWSPCWSAATTSAGTTGATGSIAPLAAVEAAGGGRTSAPFDCDQAPIAPSIMIPTKWLPTRFLVHVITAEPPSEMQVTSRRSNWFRTRRRQKTILQSNSLQRTTPQTLDVWRERIRSARAWQTSNFHRHGYLSKPRGNEQMQSHDAGLRVSAENIFNHGTRGKARKQSRVIKLSVQPLPGDSYRS